MAQTSEGAAKARAKRVGIALADLLAKEAGGEKWCWSCAEWRARVAFNKDLSRYDNLCARCQTCTRVKARVSRKGIPTAFKGRKHTPEARAAMSIARLGKPSPNKGRTMSAERRAQISVATRASPNLRRGAACHSYIDGKAAERFGLRATSEYKTWRRAVYERDAFTCQDGAAGCSKRLHAHHRRPFATDVLGRFDVDNGITLCAAHHKARHASGNL